jgi:hypothetical protein
MLLLAFRELDVVALRKTTTMARPIAASAMMTLPEGARNNMLLLAFRELDVRCFAEDDDDGEADRGLCNE